MVKCGDYSKSPAYHLSLLYDVDDGDEPYRHMIHIIPILSTLRPMISTLSPFLSSISKVLRDARAAHVLKLSVVSFSDLICTDCRVSNVFQY